MSSNRVLGDWLDGYMEYVENSEPPRLFKLWCGISGLCAAIRRRCWLQWESPIYPNMYIVLVGPSASRKGTAMGPIYNMLSNLGINIAAEAITREALIRELANCSELDESLNQYAHASLTIFSQELTVFLGQNNWQLISDLTNWYDCADRWTYRTKNMGEDEILGVWVNLLGATTPDYLAAALPQDAIGGGLTSRVIFIYGDRLGKIVPFPFKSDAEHELGDFLFNDLSSIQLLRGPFEVSRQFLDLYRDWYIKTLEQPPFENDAFIGYNGRRSTHLRKLCMIMSVSRSNDMIITEKDFHRAATILEETESMMEYTFIGRGQAKNVKTFESLLRLLAEKGQLTIRQILRRYKADITSADLRDIIHTMQTAGYVKEDLTENGEPRITYLGNPKKRETKK